GRSGRRRATATRRSRSGPGGCRAASSGEIESTCCSWVQNPFPKPIAGNPWRQSAGRVLPESVGSPRNAKTAARPAPPGARVISFWTECAKSEFSAGGCLGPRGEALQSRQNRGEVERIFEISGRTGDSYSEV